MQWTEILISPHLKKLGDAFPSVGARLDWKRGEEGDTQIVLHPQYVSELVAMQQDWESVEEGDGKKGTV